MLCTSGCAAQRILLLHGARVVATGACQPHSTAVAAAHAVHTDTDSASRLLGSQSGFHACDGLHARTSQALSAERRQLADSLQHLERTAAAAQGTERCAPAAAQHGSCLLVLVCSLQKPRAVVAAAVQVFEKARRAGVDLPEATACMHVQLCVSVPTSTARRHELPPAAHAPRCQPQLSCPGRPTPAPPAAAGLHDAQAQKMTSRAISEEARVTRATADCAAAGHAGVTTCIHLANSTPWHGRGR